MVRSTNASRPGRALLYLLTLTGLIFGSIALGATTSDGQWTPKLALDLEGGYQIIQSPRPQPGEEGQVTSEQIEEAVEIIRQRVNGSGVSEAEVTTEGSGDSQSIVVSLPGVPDEETRELVKQSAELTFRPVLVQADAAPIPPPPSPTPTPAPSGSASATPDASPSASPEAEPDAEPEPEPSATNSRIVPQALTRSAASTPAPEPSAEAAEPGAAEPTEPAEPGAAEPTEAAEPGEEEALDPGAGVDPNAGFQDPSPAAVGTASDLGQITPDLEQQFSAETCANLDEVRSAPQPLDEVIVTCSNDGLVKYLLGPVEVRGTNIADANSAMGTTQTGASNGQWVVSIEFDDVGTQAFADVTERLSGLTGAQNQFAIVLDQVVISAPTTNERIPGGEAQISGTFNQETASELASQLKFGALPVSFEVDTENQISALLGGEQLQRGLLAGLIGLVLVVLYSLLQYRALGLVTIFSLLIAAVLTYGMVVLLGWTQGYRLSLSGVAGLIVAIGITADSFIVYFERIRDEVREGRPLNSAVEVAWTRARRTILISDAVSFLAAVVLYLLAVGGVRGFAFTLGLTTLIDVVVVFLFTKPMVTLLARTHFFASGHRLSGFSPEQLGRATTYTGRGRIRPAGSAADTSTSAVAGATTSASANAAGQSIAARRAARLAAADTEASRDPQTADPDGPAGSDPGDSNSSPVTAGGSTAPGRDA